jgi:peptide/nickel transport system ATP-binding protein/oligopeptide transport system ATP-binding protein
MDPPSGCRFHTRCPFVIDRCRVDDPALAAIEPGHFTACHRAHELPPASAAEDVTPQTPIAARRMALYAERRARVTESAA